MSPLEYKESNFGAKQAVVPHDVAPVRGLEEAMKGESLVVRRRPGVCTPGCMMPPHPRLANGGDSKPNSGFLAHQNQPGESNDNEPVPSRSLP